MLTPFTDGETEVEMAGSSQGHKGDRRGGRGVMPRQSPCVLSVRVPTRHTGHPKALS